MPNLDYALPSKAGHYAQLKARIAGLAVACPVEQDNPCDCPLYAVRKLSMHDRYRWLESLQPEQVKNFLIHHGECIVRKEHEAKEPA